MTFSPRFVKLNEVTTLRNGAGIKQDNFTDKGNGIPLVKVSNFTQNSIDMNELTMVTFDHAQKWKSHIIHKGNVLIATVGSWPPNWSSVVGKVVRAPQNAEGAIQNQNTCCMLPTEEVYEGYLYYKLKDPKFLEWVVNIAQGSANQARVPVKKLGEYYFELPPMDIQKLIANALESLDYKISVNSHINQTLEQMAQAIFKSWFVDFDPVKAKMRGEQPEGMDEATASLFPEKLVESELGLIPDGWEASSLSELIKLTGGGTPKRSEETYWNGDIPWFSVKDVPSGSNVFVVNTDEKITELGLNKSSTKLLPKGTTIITARGTVGKLALVGTDMCMNQSCYGIRGKDVGDYYNYFNLKQAVSTLQQNTHGAVFDTITTKTFDTYSMAFSGAELANKFDALVAPLLQKVEANVRQNIELATLRDTLLPKLLSGEIELDSVVAK
ncbi:restriction endonuclease subunit S [Vibrio casei]|uniref:restriction endonuclease subunit S n=1 Tax=Vibrio casei TaxID=673372 RepID=UPI003F9C56CA